MTTGITPAASERHPPQSSNPFEDVPIEIRVSVGRAHPSIQELLAFGPESVLELDRKIDDPVELFIGDRIIARGVLEASDDGPAGQLVVRLTEVIRDGAMS
ncbi:FliM/FliN family flagellar motor switch protein [Fluviibacterium sp. DFM31]|uniref:Flagellar motor switch protein FliN n=1 Tax=Meridianimarinicoccus marinus TaxID=3231483 RepID=A0ABV3L323_9RHOB